MDFDEETGIFNYPCPCGDKFVINLEMLENKNNIATCPSCSLTIRIIYDDDLFTQFKN